SVYALNTAYLAATASPTVFYYGNVVFHIVGGVALLVAWLVWGKGRRVRRSFSEGGKTAPYTIAYTILAVGIAFGLLITVVGAAGRCRWLLPVHITLSLAGGVPLAIAGAFSIRLRGAPGERAPVVTACAVAVIAAVVVPVAATMSAARATNTNIIRNPSVVPASMNEEGAGQSSPFFPSSGDTNVHRTIPANFFMTSDSCGRCHTDIYKQWKSSTHHFSSFNNQWYRKSIEYMQDTVGTKPSKW